MRALARGLVAALVWLAVAAPLAFAHATLVRTAPATGSVFKTQPAEVKLSWSEPVDLGPGSVRLLDASGKTVKTDKATHEGGDPTTAALRLPRGLENGTYVISWRVTSADSHPVSGAFSFSIGQPSSYVTAGSPGSAGTGVRVADGIARGLSFVGFALAVGGACVFLLLWPEGGGANARGRRFLQVGIGLLMVGTVALLLLQGPYASGDSLLGAFKPSLLSFSVSTRFGEALIVRLQLALLFAGLVAQALREGVSRGLVWGAGACAVALLFTWTLADHSRTGVQAWLGVPVASVHLLAMTLWLGGLAFLLWVREALEPAVPRFSRMALGCFAVLGVTGVYLAWRQAGEVAALPATGFGRMLLIKSAIVLAIIALAYFSRRAVGRRAFGGLRRTVLAEAVLGIVVLGVTAGLVNAKPARVAYAPPFNATVPGIAGGKVQVHVQPAKQGVNVADIYLVQRDGRLYIPPEVTAKLREKKIALPVKLGSAEPGHYVATAMSVPYPGHWTLELRVRTSEIDESVIRVPVRIR
jgi:copper transport protein